MNAYISSPEGVQPVRGTLLLLPDGFGLARHNLMLADAFAQTGWRVIVPDLFEGKLNNTTSLEVLSKGY